MKRGHELFFGKAGCNQCHFGGAFSDGSFHNLGVGWDDKTHSFSDEGRYAVTKQPSDVGAFNLLRNGLLDGGAYGWLRWHCRSRSCFLEGGNDSQRPRIYSRAPSVG